MSVSLGSPVPAGLRLDAAVLCVVDVGRSMPVWQRLTWDLTRTLQASELFRRVDCVSMGDHSLEEAVALSDRATRVPRVVVVLSDCVGDAWERPDTVAQFAAWGAVGPVVVLNPLPERLWSRTALHPIRANLTAAWPLSPNSEMTVRAYGTAGSRALASLRGAARPVPLPVLGAGMERLLAWCGFLAAPAEAGFDCALAFAEPAWVRHTLPVQAGSEEDVAVFLASASPSAVRLATHLSAIDAWMDLDTMRFIQERVSPGSGPGDLAEILLGGLLVVEDDPSASEHEDRYRFRESARVALVRRLPLAAHGHVLRWMAERIGGRLGDEYAELGLPEEALSADLVPTAEAITADLVRRLRVPEASTGTELTEAGVFSAQADRARARFRATGRVEELKNAVGLRLAALTSSDRSSRAETALRCAREMEYRWFFTRSSEDLNSALTLLRAAHSALPDAGSPGLSFDAYLSALSALAKYDSGESSRPMAFAAPWPGDPELLPVLELLLSVCEPPRDLSTARLLLGVVERDGAPADLALARLMHACALSGSIGDPSPDQADAAEAIELFRQVSQKVADDDGTQPAAWDRLAARRALLLAQVEGGLDSLDWAIGLLRTAAARAVAGRAEHVMLLSDLAVALRSRYDARHEPGDLAEAILHLRMLTTEAAVPEAVPADVLARCFYELGRAFERKYQLDRRLSDLGEASRTYDIAVRLSAQTRSGINAASLGAWGGVLHLQGRYEEARSRLTEGVTVFELLGRGTDEAAVTARELLATLDEYRW